MIKLEDRASVVILSLITFMGIFYAIMFLNDTFATAFAAPVVVGTMLTAAALALRKSL